MSRIIRREIVKSDIEECFVFIAEDNLDFALLFLEAAEDSFEFLVQNRFLGSPRGYFSDRLKDLRMWQIKGFEDYCIFYRPVEEGIEILRVLHVRRDIKSIFSE